MEENTTHPNAYRVEAQEKRTAAALLASEANELEAKADLLEHPEKALHDSDVAVEASAAHQAEETQEKRKLFKK